MHPSGRNSIDRSRNANYETDINYITRHNKWVLNSIGIWPVAVRDIRKFLPKIIIGISNLMLSFTLLQCVLHVAFEQKDPLLRLKFFGLIVFSFIALMKYWALTLRKPNIKRCIEQIHADWKEVSDKVEYQGDRKVMLECGKIGRNLTMYSAVFMYSTFVLYHTIMHYTMSSYVDEYNRTIKLLIYPTYNGLYDVQRSPVYELMYFFQLMCGYVFDTVIAGTSGLVALFGAHACGQIDVVISRLKELVQFAEDNSYSNKRLIEIVDHHVRSLKFSAKIRTVLQEVCFFDLIGSTFVMCLAEYFSLTDLEQNNIIGVATYSIVLVSLTFNMFLLCYISDLLLEKSTNVGMTCSMIDWYQLPAETIHGLVLIIARSNNPAKISAGGIADLSLSTFGKVGFSISQGVSLTKAAMKYHVKVLKTSFAYLSFLRAMI